MFGLGESHERLDAAVEVAVHHVGAADVDLRVAVVLEPEHAGVLEVAAEDRTHPDRLAEPGHPRTDGADAADDEVNRHSRLARAVERVDDLLVDDRVQLDADATGLARGRVVALGVDALDEPLAQVQWRDEEALELLLDRVARELVEESCEVAAHDGVGSEEPEVFI